MMAEYRNIEFWKHYEVEYRNDVRMISIHYEDLMKLHNMRSKHDVSIV
jgi:hypothetical protein